jgi:hypothetical protein
VNVRDGKCGVSSGMPVRLDKRGVHVNEAGSEELRVEEVVD